MLAAHGSDSCGLRWFIEIEISPVRGETRAICS